jgi:hypothetical protein
MATRIVQVPGRIFYCNGITTSEEEALDHARQIERVTGVRTELHHNDTTSTDDVWGIVAKIGLGILGVAYAAGSEKKTTKKKAADTVIGGASAASIAWGLNDYRNIQRQKNASARDLADRAIEYLNEHPLYHITFILHSQGADIGLRALELLASFKDRINVVTIGGMVDVPTIAADRVVNFVNENDMVSHLAKFVFDHHPGSKVRVITPWGRSGVVSSHNASDYLRTPVIQNTLRDVSRPRLYAVR